MSDAAEAGEEDPREHAAKIERLLGDVRASVGPVAWRRVEELVSRLVALYGAALGRTLRLVEETGALDERLRARLCADELVSSLLTLHGMHPDPPLSRAGAAVERVRAQLGSGAGEVELALDDRGGLRAALVGEWRCAAPRAAVGEALRRALEEAVPELAIELEGLGGDAPPLVQVDLARSRAGSDARR